MINTFTVGLRWRHFRRKNSNPCGETPLAAFETNTLGLGQRLAAFVKIMYPCGETALVVFGTFLKKNTKYKLVVGQRRRHLLHHP